MPRATGDMTGLWVGRWQTKPQRSVLGDPASAMRAAKVMDRPEIRTVADWGCGMGGLRRYLRADQGYLGIDGSPGPCVDVEADLRSYRHPSDAVHMRSVLEHNLEWATILGNAIASARRLLIVTLFTPWADGPTIDTRRGRPSPFPVIRFSREEFLSQFPTGPTEVAVKTTTGYGQDTMLAWWRQTKDA